MGGELSAGGASGWMREKKGHGVYTGIGFYGEVERNDLSPKASETNLIIYSGSVTKLRD